MLGEADERLVSAIASKLCISRLTARVLVRRGVAGPDIAESFLKPSLEGIPDPASIPDLRRASARIAEAVGRRERIAIFGDYDVDGITGSALLAQFLREVGADAFVRLPNRMQDGYGITPEVVDRLRDEGAGLIVTVDNGTSAHEAADRAREVGLDLIVTDHHTVGARPSDAWALVNPKRLDPSSETYHLAGCGVAFMLCVDLRRLLRESGRAGSPEPNLKRTLDLVALGTIADAVPLTGVNRILAHAGLREISLAQRTGIRTLLDVSGTEHMRVGTQAVGFRLGPRLNAAGRIGDPSDSLKLLMSDDASEARELAKRLDCANGRRQTIQESCLRQALKRASAQAEGGAIVVDSEGWHAGVIGIVAAKLAERFSRPAVVITRDATPPRGSCRSFGGIDLMKALDECEGLLIRHGGHKDAAGLSIDAERIEDFSEAFAEACSRHMAGAPPRPVVLDAVVEADSIDGQLIAELSALAPFGEGNPEPLFGLGGARLVSQRLVGSGHLKLSIEADGRAFQAIGFGMNSLLPGDARSIDLAFTPEHNTYNGRTTIQLRLRDISQAEV